MGKYRDFLKGAYEGTHGLSMCQSWRTYIEETFPEFKPRFEEGDWLYFEGTDARLVTPTWKIGSVWKWEGARTVSQDLKFGNASNCPSQFRKAKDHEVKAHLIKEAKKRGFKKGVKFVSPSGKSYVAKYGLDYERLFYGREWGCDSFNMALCDNGGVIYNTEGWATIVEEPEKEMTLEEIEKELGYKVKIRTKK